MTRQELLQLAKRICEDDLIQMGFKKSEFGFCYFLSLDDKTKAEFDIEVVNRCKNDEVKGYLMLLEINSIEGNTASRKILKRISTKVYDSRLGISDELKHNFNEIKLYMLGE